MTEHKTTTSMTAARLKAAEIHEFYTECDAHLSLSPNNQKNDAVLVQKATAVLEAFAQSENAALVERVKELEEGMQEVRCFLRDADCKIDCEMRVSASDERECTCGLLGLRGSVVSLLSTTKGGA